MGGSKRCDGASYRPKQSCPALSDSELSQKGEAVKRISTIPVLSEIVSIVTGYLMDGSQVGHGCCIDVALILHGCCIDVAWMLYRCCIDAAWMLHGCCTDAAWMLSHVCCIHIAYMLHGHNACMVLDHCDGVTKLA